MHRVRTSGFTLVELMVTIAIVAILLAVGLPSFQSSLRSNRVATATNEMLASLSLARTEAIKSTQASQICARDGNECGDDWNEGWLVVTDMDGDGTFETTVKAVDGHPDLSITMTDGTDNTVVAFDRRGRMDDVAKRKIEILPNAENVDEAHIRCMTISVVGQVNTAKGACEE